MGDPPTDAPIPRGADLTEADLQVLADDMRTVTVWCMRNRLKRDEWTAQLRETLRARLGRRPLVAGGPSPSGLDGADAAGRPPHAADSSNS